MNNLIVRGRSLTGKMCSEKVSESLSFYSVKLFNIIINSLH